MFSQQPRKSEVALMIGLPPLQPCPNTLDANNEKKSEKWKWAGWTGAFLVVFGYYLNANFYDSCWLVWIIGNLMVAGYCFSKEAYPTVVMSLIIVIMNIYGLLQW